MANLDPDDVNRGLYDKFIVRRTDGTDQPGERHDACRYFVLDVDHDPHAAVALRAYATACDRRQPRLAADLRQLAHSNEAKFYPIDPGTPRQEFAGPQSRMGDIGRDPNL